MEKKLEDESDEGMATTLIQQRLRARRVLAPMLLHRGGLAIRGDL
jgi:hypothetical protein